MFCRAGKTWGCRLGHKVTDEYCVDWVDCIDDIHVRMPDGCVMHVSLAHAVNIS